jgi:hypothetical protein
LFESSQTKPMAKSHATQDKVGQFAGMGLDKRAKQRVSDVSNAAPTKLTLDKGLEVPYQQILALANKLHHQGDISVCPLNDL